MPVCEGERSLCLPVSFGRITQNLWCTRSGKSQRFLINTASLWQSHIYLEEEAQCLHAGNVTQNNASHEYTLRGLLSSPVPPSYPELAVFI